LTIRRCPRCQSTYEPPARYCVKDGGLLVEEAGQLAATPARPHPARFSDGPDPRTEPPATSEHIAPSSDPLTTLAGQTLDRRYRAGKRLGEGGMSYVYRAEEIETGRQVAVKILLPRLSRDPASVERLRREATIAMRLDHPNVCPILRLGETGDRLIYLVMPFLDGEPLSEHESRRGPFPVNEGPPNRLAGRTYSDGAQPSIVVLHKSIVLSGYNLIYPLAMLVVPGGALKAG